MQNDETKLGQEAMAQGETKKKERRAAIAEFKRLHALDPAQAREAARLWFERNAEQVDAEEAERSAFHRRKLSEADPERIAKAAEAARRNEADAGRAQSASHEAVKEWRKRNPNKVKKLNKSFRERQKAK